MNVVGIATNDLRGGAARAAYRLHTGLCDAGISATMLVRWKQSHDASVTQLPESWFGAELLERERNVRQRWVRENRTTVTDTLFSLGSPSVQVAAHPAVQSADIIHLHWVANFLGPSSFTSLARLGKPIVWTLHDEWGYTGGCHYRAGCELHRERCTACPQLREDPLGLVPSLFDERRSAWHGAPLTVVGPSAWIAARAAESAILGGAPTKVIPYGVDTDVFKPASIDDRSAFRERYDIANEAFVVAFGVDRLGERRKGYDHLTTALELVARRLPKAVLLRFGEGGDARVPSLPTIDLGSISDDRTLALAYSSADCFVLPALEDNLPNGVLESMACGTPVIAYATGGIPEIVEHGRTGFLVPAGDTSQLGESIVSASSAGERLKTMGREARGRIESEHTLARQAARHVGLYAGILARRRSEAAA
ncbi:MAG: glycosyltransferase [Phycisphaerales bacterium]